GRDDRNAEFNRGGPGYGRVERTFQGAAARLPAGKTGTCADPAVFERQRRTPRPRRIERHERQQDREDDRGRSYRSNGGSRSLVGLGRLERETVGNRGQFGDRLRKIASYLTKRIAEPDRFPAVAVD